MTTALVLSGGGLFGAYQAGAWQALEANGVRPDLIVGASVGSLNGRWIAAGLSGLELVARWMDPSAGRLTRIAPLYGGLLDRRSLIESAQELTALPLRIRYAVTAVRLPRFQTELFVDGDVTWRHLVASCSIPLGYPPTRISSGWYVDGGLICALPVWAAEQLGATRIFTLNVLPYLPSRTLRALSRGLRRVVREVPPQPGLSKARIISIVPAEPLGPLGTSVNWDATRIGAWIDRGRRDAERVLAADFKETPALAGGERAETRRREP